MLLETEIMMTQRNVERLNVEDLTEVAIQKCFLKWVFFKAIRILKTACVCIHFKKKLQVKKITPSASEFFFKDLICMS